MKLCANSEKAEALYLMGKQTMYTPIMGDETSQPASQPAISSYNDDNGLQLHRKEGEDEERANDFEGKPVGSKA